MGASNYEHLHCFFMLPQPPKLRAVRVRLRGLENLELRKALAIQVLNRAIAHTMDMRIDALRRELRP